MIKRKVKFGKIDFFFMFVVLLSFYFIPADTNFSIELWLFIYIIAYFGLIVIKKGKIKINKCFENWCYLGIFCIILLNNLRSDSKMYISYLLSFAIFTLYLFSCEKNKTNIVKSIRYLQKFSFVMSLVVIFFSFYQNLCLNIIRPFVTDSIYIARAYNYKIGYGASFGGVTFTDYIIISGIIISISKIKFQFYEDDDNEKKKKLRKKNYIYIVVGIFALVLVGRRSELFFFLVAMLISYIAFCDLKHKIFRILFVLVICVIGYNLILLILPYLSSIEFLGRYINTITLLLGNADAEQLTVGRSYLWELAFRLFKQHKLFGIGWGGFASYVPDSFKSSYGSGVVDAHNVYLQLLCEIGIVGGGLVIAGILIPLAITIKKIDDRVRNKINDKSMSYLYISFFIQIFFLCVSFVEPCFTKITYLGFFAIALMFSGEVNSAKKGQIFNHDNNT